MTAVPVAPLPRPAVYGGLVVGVLAVSTSAILAAVIIGDPPVLRLALAAAFWRCFGGALSLAAGQLAQVPVHEVAPSW